jgi:hypothetical protein
MKQFLFRSCLLLIALTMLPSMAEAKKIQFGQFISYDGKLNSEGKPEGKGALVTVYGSMDVLKGIFSNGKVTEAELLFCATDKKNYLAKFEGTLEYKVDTDGSGVTYKLLEGFFTAHSEMFRIVEDNPQVITRLPSAKECTLQHEGYLTRAAKVDYGNRSEMEKLITMPLELDDFLEGNIYYNVTSYYLDKSFTPQIKQDYHLLIDSNKNKVQRDGNRVSLICPNSDNITYEYGSGDLIGFKIKFKEGTIVFEGDPCMNFTSNSNEKGLAAFEKVPDLNIKRFAKIRNTFTINRNPSVKDLNINIFMGQDAIAMKSKLQAEGLRDMIFIAIGDNSLELKDINFYASSPAGRELLERIFKQLFSKEEELTKKLLATEKSEERENALTQVYDYLKITAKKRIEDASWGRGEAYGERGKKEQALAECIKKQMNEEGYTKFGFVKGQKEGDVVEILDGILKRGTILHKKNGVLTIDDSWGGGKMVFTMNDGTVFKGYFKEQVKFFGDSNQYSSYDEIADAKLVEFEELTPWSGSITYADGTTDELTAGKSMKAIKKAEQEKQNAAYDTLCKQFGKKYVDAAGNGQIIVGMPEKLMVATFNAKLYGQSGNSKTYRIYGYGSRERLDGSIYVSGDHHLMTVWVSGGKVTSFRKWE